MSSTSEIQNFFSKFQQLMKAGQTAHLDLDTHAGQAWIGLKVMIRPFQPQQNQHHSSRKSRNPAYYRRQERRKALRKAAKASTEPSDTNAEEAAKASTKPSDTKAEEAIVPDKKAEDPDKKVEDTEVTISENLASEATDKNVETFSVISDKKDKASNTDITICAVEKKLSFHNKEEGFSCELCDFKCSSEKGLNTHITRKHPKIDQLDGNISYIETGESNLNPTATESLLETLSESDTPPIDTQSLLETLSESLSPAPSQMTPALWNKDEINQFINHKNEIYSCMQILQSIDVKIHDDLISMETRINDKISDSEPHDDENADDDLLIVLREIVKEGLPKDAYLSLNKKIRLEINNILWTMKKELENKLSDLEWVDTEIDKRFPEPIEYNHYDVSDESHSCSDFECDDSDPEYPKASYDTDDYTDDEW